MRTYPMKQMPVVVKATGQGAVVLDMDLPDDAFTDDGEPRGGYIIPGLLLLGRHAFPPQILRSSCSWCGSPFQCQT